MNDGLYVHSHIYLHWLFSISSLCVSFSFRNLGCKKFRMKQLGIHLMCASFFVVTSKLFLVSSLIILNYIFRISFEIINIGNRNRLHDFGYTVNGG